jgi:hypothetical protein
VKRDAKRSKTQKSKSRLDLVLKISPPWVGTAFEAPLRRIEIAGANESEQTRFWNLIYGLVERIGRDFACEPGKRLLLSKEAVKKRSIAEKLRKLAVAVEPFAPGYAEQCLRRPSETFAFEAHELVKLARVKKRHSQHPETSRTLDLMREVQDATGKSHDREIVDLLRLAGLHHASAQMLRTLRCRKRYKSNPELA